MVKFFVICIENGNFECFLTKKWPWDFRGWKCIFIHWVYIFQCWLLYMNRDCSIYGYFSYIDVNNIVYTIKKLWILTISMVDCPNFVHTHYLLLILQFVMLAYFFHFSSLIIPCLLKITSIFSLYNQNTFRT